MAREKEEAEVELELSTQYTEAPFSFVEVLDASLDGRGRVQKTFPHRKNHPVKLLILPKSKNSNMDELKEDISAMKSDMRDLFIQIGALIEKVEGRL